MPVMSGCEPAEIAAHAGSVCGTPQQESRDGLKEADKIAKVRGHHDGSGSRRRWSGPKASAGRFPSHGKKAPGTLGRKTQGQVKVGPFAPGWVPPKKQSA